MVNRMNRVRALTGGLAAIMIMSNVATITTYAADPEEVTVAVEQTAAPEAVVPETAKDDEAPSGMQPAPEYAEIEEAQVIEVPAPETTAPEAVVPETVKDDEAPSGMQPAPEYAEAEEAPVIEAPAPVEMGTAKAGNFEENEEPETAAPEAAEAEAVPAEEVEVVENAAPVKEVATVEEKIVTTADEEVPVEIGTAKAGNFVDDTDPDTVQGEADGNLPTIVRSEENSTDPISAFGILTRPGMKTRVDYYSNGEVIQTVMMTDKDGNVVATKMFRLRPGNTEIIESGDVSEVFADKQAERIDAEQKARAEAEKKAAEEKAKAKAELEKKVKGMSLTEIMDYYKKLSTVNTKLAEKTTEGGQVELTEEEQSLEDDIAEFGMDMLKEVVSNGIDKLIEKVPGSDIYGGPIKSLFKKGIGLEEDKGPDLTQTVHEEADRVIGELKQMQKEMKDDNINAEAFQSYNNTLNAFDEYVDNRVKEIELTNQVNSYSDTEKLIRNAYTIGGEADWLRGDLSVFDYLRNAGKVLQGGKTSDKDDRSYFDLLYDYHKDSSLFSGEAMQKAEKYIQARLQRFTESCNNVLQILNMQKQVCDLSEDEVNKLDEKTREYYKAIKTNKDAIQVRIDFITGIFTNPVKTDASNDLVKSRTRGIFSTAKMYYHKAKTVYIGNKNNKEGVWLRDNLCSFKGDDYNGYVKDDYEYESSIDNKDVYDEVKKDLNKGKLTTEDIKKIAKQAKAMNMTIKDYLAYCGFNVQTMPDGGILVSEAVNRESTFWNRTENSCGVNGYKVDDANAKENYTVLLTDRSYENAQNKGASFIYFRTR